MVDPPPFNSPETNPLRTLSKALTSIPECSKNRSSSVATRASTNDLGKLLK